MTTQPTPKPPEFPPAPEGMVNVVVDGVHHIVPRSFTVMQACKKAEKEIPHFCYHERLSIAGNCRMCLVEIEGAPKPVASCHWPVAEGMKVKTNSPLTQAARKGTMELLLINHPLDCPICDQGGECQLQDQSVAYGGDRSHYTEMKRAVEDKDIGAKIKTVMTRCIHCTRCIRFATEIAGVEEFGATFRGENMQVGTYVEQALQSELAGNMIDLCPVGALTNKPYAFTARPWELTAVKTIDILDAIGTPIFADVRAGKVMRIRPQTNDAINEEWMTDAARFSYNALHTNRLGTPLIKGKPATWPEAFAAVKKIIEKAEGKVGAILGDMASAETAYSFVQFMQTVLQTKHVSALPAGRPVGMPYTFTTALAGFDTAEAVLLVGTNPRREAPLLNVRLRRGALKRNMKVGHIGTAADLTYAHVKLGDTMEAFAPMMGVKVQSANPQVVIGASVLARPDAADILAKSASLGALNILEESCGRITAQDMNAHQTDTADTLKLWQSGKLTTLWVHGDDSVSAKDIEAGKGALIYCGTHKTDLAEAADICLPIAAWAEEKGLYANAEGRVQEAMIATPAPMQAKESWKIYRALSEELGATLPWNTMAQLREAVAKAHLSYAENARDQVLPRPSCHPCEGRDLVEKSTSSKQAKNKSTEIPAFAGMTKVKFKEAVQAYYLRTTYLRQSPEMQAIQAEVGTAKVKKEAA